MINEEEISQIKKCLVSGWFRWTLNPDEIFIFTEPDETSPGMCNRRFSSVKETYFFSTQENSKSLSLNIGFGEYRIEEFGFNKDDLFFITLLDKANRKSKLTEGIARSKAC